MKRRRVDFDEGKCENSIISSTAFSLLGFAYVIYFYQKLLESEQQSTVESESLTVVTTENADTLNLNGVDLEAYWKVSCWL